MDNQYLTRREFEQYVKSTNGSLVRIEKQLVRIEEKFDAHCERTIRKSTAWLVTFLTTLSVSSLAIMITVLVKG